MIFFLSRQSLQFSLYINHFNKLKRLNACFLIIIVKLNKYFNQIQTNYFNSIFISSITKTKKSIRHLRQFGLMTEDPTVWWKAGLGIAAATVLGFFVVKAFHTPINTR